MGENADVLAWCHSNKYPESILEISSVDVKEQESHLESLEATHSG